MYPSDRKYSKEHEWVKVDGDEAIVGITYFAQEKLGDVVFVELPIEGDCFQLGEGFGVVESVKAVSDLYAPLDGEVVKINEKLLDSPELVNEDPYDQGWMVVFKIADSSQLDALMDSEAYQVHIKEEG